MPLTSKKLRQIFW